MGTGTGVAPVMPMAAVRLGHAGCGMITSSPVPATMRQAIWMACMPPPATKKRSGTNGLP